MENGKQVVVMCPNSYFPEGALVAYISSLGNFLQVFTIANASFSICEYLKLDLVTFRDCEADATGFRVTPSWLCRGSDPSPYAEASALIFILAIILPYSAKL